MFSQQHNLKKGDEIFEEVYCFVACAMTTLPLHVLADDGGYTVHYFENETEYFHYNGTAGSGNFGAEPAFSGAIEWVHHHNC